MTERSTGLIQEMADTCVLMRTRLIARVVTSIYDDHVRPHGLNAAQCSLLVVMSRLGPTRRAGIGRFAQLDRSTLSRNLALLLAAGWIAEVDAQGDGRGKPIAVTPAGRNLLTQTYPAWQAAQAEVRATLGEGAGVLTRLGDELLGLPAEG